MFSYQWEEGTIEHGDRTLNVEEEKYCYILSRQKPTMKCVDTTKWPVLMYNDRIVRKKVL